MSRQDTMIRQIENQLEKQIGDYEDTDKDKLESVFENLVDDCIKIKEKYLENDRIPLFISPINEDSSNYVTWQFIYDSNPEIGDDYANYDDNVCRDFQGIKRYPNLTRNGQIDLIPCNKFFNPTVNSIRSMKDFINSELIKSKIFLVSREITDSQNVSNIRKNIRDKVKEFENLQYQYLQLLQLIEINTDLISRREKTLNDDGNKVEKLDNNSNIKEEEIKSYIKNKESNQNTEDNQVFYLKILSSILLIITIGLFLLKKTK